MSDRQQASSSAGGHESSASADSGSNVDQSTRDSPNCTVGTGSQRLIDTLKCQLQQATLAQQATSLQLDAARQVILMPLISSHIRYQYQSQIYLARASFVIKMQSEARKCNHAKNAITPLNDWIHTVYLLTNSVWTVITELDIVKYCVMM